MLRRVREGAGSPLAPRLAYRTVEEGVERRSRAGLTVMRNEQSAEKLMAPADCAGWRAAGGLLQPARRVRYANAGRRGPRKGRKKRRHKGEKCK